MVLEIIWFFLWGLLWALFFVTDGFDFGVGTLYPFLGKTEDDKRAMINSIGPLWDGNEVWLITAGGVTFAAFPALYAMMFSSLYTPLMFILFTLILRGVSFEFRGHIDNPGWKKIWDICIFVGSFTPAFLFGVTFANIFRGLPFDSSGYHGNLLSLLNPYGLLGGVLFVLLFLQHGSLWLCIKTESDLLERSEKAANKIWPVLVAVAVIFLVVSWFDTSLYLNYLKNPTLFLVIFIAVAALLGIKIFTVKKYYFKAWFSSALAILACTFFGIIGIYPNMFPSRMDPASSLTAFNASSSPLTLKIMLTVVIIFIPIVIGYQAWAYNLFKGKITEEEMKY